MDKKVLSFNMPCVLRQVPGFNNDNPFIVLFEDPEDAKAYWRENEYDDCLCETEEGYNYLYIGQEVDITHFDHVDIKYMSHEEASYDETCLKYPVDGCMNCIYREECERGDNPCWE